MSEVLCSSCGKKIFRRKKVVKNRYGTWQPKCDECKKSEYKIKQSERIKIRYKEDSEFRQRVIDKSKDRYWKKRVPLALLTDDEKHFLASSNSYPVLGPGCLGTTEITTNCRIIVLNNVERVKGAVFLEEYGKRHKNS
jgi:hypothetical protein